VKGHFPQSGIAGIPGIVHHGFKIQSARTGAGQGLARYRVEKHLSLPFAFHPLAGGKMLQFIHGGTSFLVGRKYLKL
jgi:hypothetical protein